MRKCWVKGRVKVRKIYFLVNCLFKDYVDGRFYGGYGRNNSNLVKRIFIFFLMFNMVL